MTTLTDKNDQAISRKITFY